MGSQPRDDDCLRLRIRLDIPSGLIWISGKMLDEKGRGDVMVSVSHVNVEAICG